MNVMPYQRPRMQSGSPHVQFKQRVRGGRGAGRGGGLRRVPGGRRLVSLAYRVLDEPALPNDEAEEEDDEQEARPCDSQPAPW